MSPTTYISNKKYNEGNRRKIQITAEINTTENKSTIESKDRNSFINNLF